MNNLEIVEKRYFEAVQGIKEEWFTSANSNWYNYIVELPKELQITYLVIVLHNQVFNGGFHQYFVNGYGQFAKETINALLKIGAIKKAELLKQAFTIVNSDKKSDVEFREKLLKKAIDLLFVTDDLFGPLDKLDSEYYTNDAEDLTQLLGNYLKKY